MLRRVLFESTIHAFRPSGPQFARELGSRVRLKRSCSCVLRLRVMAVVARCRGRGVSMRMGERFVEGMRTAPGRTMGRLLVQPSLRLQFRLTYGQGPPPRNVGAGLYVGCAYKKLSRRAPPQQKPHRTRIGGVGMNRR